MPIYFNAVEDPYGIRQAGGVLGQALQERNLEKLKNKRQLEAEARQDARTLEAEKRAQDRKIEDENRKIDTQTKKGQNISSQLGSLSKILEPDILQAVKGIVEQDPESGLSILNNIINNKLKPTVPKETTKEKADANAYSEYLQKIENTSSSMKNLEREMPALQEAILQNDTNAFERWGLAFLKKTGNQDAFLNAPQQVITSVVKTAVSEMEKGGARISIPRLKFIESASPSPEKTKEANIAGFNILNRFVKIGAATGDIVNDILDENPNISKRELERELQKRLDVKFAELEKEGNELLKQAGASSNSFQIGETFDKFPDPKEYDGAEITSEDGQVYESKNGKWKKKG